MQPNPPSWPQVTSWVEDELKSARRQLEKTTLGIDDTQALRGEIRALKKLLDLPSNLAHQQAQTAPPGWPGGAES